MSDFTTKWDSEFEAVIESLKSLETRVTKAMEPMRAQNERLKFCHTQVTKAMEPMRAQLEWFRKEQVLMAEFANHQYHLVPPRR